MEIKDVNSELKKVLARVKTAQGQIQTLLKDKSWMDEAKKYAERQGKEAKKLINADVAKLKAFVEREKKELAKLQAQVPGEVAKIKKFVDSQKKELGSLLKTIQRKKKKKTRKVVRRTEKKAAPVVSESADS
jgi:hypothetical protein